MLYFHSLSVGFVGDDFYFLDSSDTWSDTLDSFWSDWFWGDEDIRGARYFRPLQILMTYVEQRVWGLNGWGYHLDLIVIHWLVSCLIVPLVYLLFKGWWKQVFAAAWLGALVFALHPRHAEPVCMINARSDSLCALFYLSSIIAYIHGRQKNRIAWLISSAFLFICALLAKEMAITLPFVLLFYEWAGYFSKKSDSGASQGSFQIKSLLPYFIILVLLFGLYRTWALGGYVFGRSTYIDVSIPAQIYLISGLKLLIALIFPFDVILHTLYTFSPVILSWSGVLSLLLIGGGLLFSIRKGNIPLTVALGFWFFTALPVLGQLSELKTTLSDRYIYIPSIGFSVIIAWIVVKARITRIRVTVLTVLMLIWIPLSVWQTHIHVQQWVTAGAFTKQVIEQIYALDQKRPEHEIFCFLSLPGLYEGKPTVDTGFERFFNNQRFARGDSIRLITPFMLINCRVPPEQVRTEFQWEGSRIQHRVEGGRFLRVFQSGYPEVQLLTDLTNLPTQQVEFQAGPVQRPLLLLMIDRGQVVTVSRPIGSLVAAQGKGGQGWIEHYYFWHMKNKHAGSYRAVPEGIRETVKLDPQRGVYLSTGRFDENPGEELLISFAPAESPDLEFPGMIYLMNLQPTGVIGHPFLPFPRQHSSGILDNRWGEVTTAASALSVADATEFLVCAQGAYTQNMIRLFSFTGKEAPYGFQVIGQFDAFEPDVFSSNGEGGVSISSADVNGDRLDELLVGQTGNHSGDPVLQVLSLEENPEKQMFQLKERSPLLVPFRDIEGPKPVGGNHTMGDVDGDQLAEIIVTPRYDPNAEQGEPNFRIQIWKPQIKEGRISGFAQLQGEVLELAQMQKSGIKSIFLDCGNLDYDPADELAVGLIVHENGRTSAYLCAFDLTVENDRISAVHTIDIIKMPWQEEDLNWVSVSVLEQ